MPAVSKQRPRPTGAGRALHVVSLVLAILALAGAVTVLAVPLPRPAAGGTCGPGTSSESAVIAFFDPVTIGAGPEPRGAGPATEYQWQAFVGQCQSSANARVAEALALLLLAGFFTLAVPPLLRRAWHGQRPAAAGAPPGWYPDPLDQSAWRWWDGGAWSAHAAPPTTPRPEPEADPAPGSSEPNTSAASDEAPVSPSAQAQPLQPPQPPQLPPPD